MRLVRQIIFILAALSILIYLTIISAFEYSNQNADLSINDDRLPIAKEMIKGVSGLVSVIEKMPVLRLIPSNIDNISYKEKSIETAYENVVDFSKNTLAEAEDQVPQAIYLEDFSYQSSLDDVQKTNWSDFFTRLKERLFSNWFSS